MQCSSPFIVQSASRSRSPPLSVETTAWGAAYIAGLARGLYPEPEALLEKWQPERHFAPQMPANEREERYAGWRRAVAGMLETVS
jgi:glycerol kinase